MSEQPTGSTSTQRFYSVKMRPRQFGLLRGPFVMNWIEAVDVHSGANGCFRRRCVDPEVEALGLRSVRPSAHG
jgi:hypothetical protein